MTDVQVFDGTSWVDIRYSEFEIEFGLSDVLIAPKATIQTDARESIAAGDELRIREDSETIFRGRLLSSGKRRRDGRRRLEAEHKAYELFDETVSINVSAPTGADVLQAALSASNSGGSFDLQFNAVDVALADDYSADDRSVKRIFRDIMDRVGTVWFVDGADDRITVDTYGARGLFASVDTQQDGAVVRQFDPDNVETVVNDVTVNGTGGERVKGSDSDADSIDQFGRRPLSVNVDYIRSTTEADDFASALLQPDPQPEAEVRVGMSVGNIAQNLSNFELEVTDPATGYGETAVVEKQTLTQGAADLQLGQGRALVKEKFNRSEKSKSDTTEPGSVYGEDRIADEAISSDKVVPGGIKEINLEDGAVSSFKLQDGSVLENNVGFQEITETKIDDDSISTPKLKANAVEADKIETGTIRGADFDRIVDGEVVDTQNIISLISDKVVFATGDGLNDVTDSEFGTTVIKGGKIETGSIEANKIDTLNLDTDQITVGGDTDTPFIFDQESGWTAMYPGSDGAGTLGLSNRRFNVINTINADFETLFTDNLTFGVQFYDIITDSFGANDTQLVPEEDNRHTIGTTSQAFESMVSHAFIEQTPDPVSKNECRLEELDYIDWFNAARYIQRDKDRRENADNENDGSGVELGAMANYLLEICKSQQQFMDVQTERIDDLESRLTALEGE